MSISPRIGDIAVGTLVDDDETYSVRGTVLVAGEVRGDSGRPMTLIVQDDGDEGWFYEEEIIVLSRPDPADAPGDMRGDPLPRLEDAPELTAEDTARVLDSRTYLTSDEFLASLDDGLAENPKDRLGVKKAALRLVPQALRILAIPAMQLGAEKYGPMNWRTKAVKMSVYLEAAQRHLAAFEDGEDNDSESGASHLSHAAACLGIIADAQALGQLEDDRMLPGPAAKMLAALDKSKEV